MACPEIASKAPRGQEETLLSKESAKVQFSAGNSEPNDCKINSIELVSVIFRIILPESTAFNHWTIAWIQNSIIKKISLHFIALRCVQRILGLVNFSQHVLRCIRRSVQCRIRPNRSSHNGCWCYCRGFVYRWWVFSVIESLINWESDHNPELCGEPPPLAISFDVFSI